MPARLVVSAALWLILPWQSLSNPSSNPYVAFRTDPFDQDTVNKMEWPEDTRKSRPQAWNKVDASQCPQPITLGYAQRPHSGIGPSFHVRKPPVIHLAKDGTRQVVYTTQYEHLDLLSPGIPETSSNIVKQALVQGATFPILFESSSFHTSPIVHDVNGDGVEDAIVCDYDGGVYITSLDMESPYRHHSQVPRLYVRRDWVASRLGAMGEKKEGSPDDPYHTYFEYAYSQGDGSKDTLIRGEGADQLSQDQVDAWRERKKRSSKDSADTSERRRRLEALEDLSEGDPAGGGDAPPQMEAVKAKEEVNEQEVNQEGKISEKGSQQEEKAEQEANNNEQVLPKDATEQHHQQDQPQKENQQDASETLERVAAGDIPVQHLDAHGNKIESEESIGDNIDADVDTTEGTQPYDDGLYTQDDMMGEGDGSEEESGRRRRTYYDDYRGDDYMMDDPEYGRHQYDGEYDDYYGYDEAHEEYYDTKNYIRIPPHILADPVLVELPKLYGSNNEKEDLLFVPVSYYLDEDEYDGFFSYQRYGVKDSGDETEAKRGSYVGSALMVYLLGTSNRWSGQEHLDLSTDYSAPENATIVDVVPVRVDRTTMGAFALSTPTVADLDGDGTREVLIGTSMGLLYVLEARQQLKRTGWPIQMPRPIESRILVEDVVGTTDLEVLVADIGGNIACFSSKAERLWHRNIKDSVGHSNTLIGSSSIALGDVNGDGVLDVVITARFGRGGFVFAYNAASGEDIPNFPISLELHHDTDTDEPDIHERLPQPLLVDLHADQSHVESYFRRQQQRTWKPPPKKSMKRPPVGGSSIGLHVVQPFGKMLYIIEAGSGCTQQISMGDSVVAMVQADDIHGTGQVDLLLSTEEGKIITLESQAPWHALNSWTNGELRGKGNAHAHGYSATQGIFVHEISRQMKNVLGVYVPLTFEIFDSRPNIGAEPERKKYSVEVRVGSASKRAVWRKDFNRTGVYTEQIYIRFGPGHHSLSIVMQTSHGLVYHDSISVSYNIGFMDSFEKFLWLPIIITASIVVLFGSKKARWDDEDVDDRRDSSKGILG